MSMNPFDEIAVEEGLRLREAGHRRGGDHRLGRRAAMPGDDPHRAGDGADRGVLVLTDVELQPLAVAKLLKAVIDKESPRSSSSASRRSTTIATQTGQMLAALLGWPQRPSPRRSRSAATRPR